MLSIPLQEYSLCDRITRRNILQVGGSALCGLSLPQLLRAEADRAHRDPHQAVIIIYLPGGLSHIDTFDLKPEAPIEVRGEFRPIQTNVSGIEICEPLPRLAATMDKLVLIRSIVGAVDDHACHTCLTGYPRLGPARPGTIRWSPLDWASDFEIAWAVRRVGSTGDRPDAANAPPAL